MNLKIPFAKWLLFCLGSNVCTEFTGDLYECLSEWNMIYRFQSINMLSVTMTVIMDSDGNGMTVNDCKR